MEQASIAIDSLPGYNDTSLQYLENYTPCQYYCIEWLQTLFLLSLNKEHISLKLLINNIYIQGI